VPCKYRRRSAVRTPAFGDLPQYFFRRSVFHAEQAADLDLDSEVPGGPDVAAPFREQQIDFGRPAADALDAGQKRDRFLVILGQGVEIEFARQDQLRKAACVTRLLARDAGGALDVG